MHLRVENLRQLGWQRYNVESNVNLGGHGQEVIPFPRQDGSVLFVPVLGEAR
jgi:hypothetical protein